MDSSVLGGFLAVALVVVLAPGSSTVLMVRAALGGGPRSGYAAWAGNNLGNWVYAGVVVSGLGVLLAANRGLMLAIQLVGGAYLFWLSLGCARSAASAWRLRSGSLDGVQAMTALDLGPAAAFRRGFLTNMTNPKVMIFFLSLLPQFMGDAASPFGQMALLGAAFVCLAMAWEAVVVLLAVRIRGLLQNPLFPVLFESLCAAVFLGLAAFVLVESAGSFTP